MRIIGVAGVQKLQNLSAALVTPLQDPITIKDELTGGSPLVRFCNSRTPVRQGAEGRKGAEKRKITTETQRTRSSGKIQNPIRFPKLRVLCVSVVNPISAASLYL
jgi:hypothetical protein